MKTIEVTQYNGQFDVNVRRNCNIKDIRIIYRVEFNVDKDFVETGAPVYEDFDEYFCGNCENYYEAGFMIERHLEGLA